MFPLINQIAEKLKLVTDQGLTHEIKHVLQMQKNIKEYKIEKTEDKYKILIKLHDCNLLESKRVFLSLVKFTQYNLTFYAHHVCEDYIEYLLISASEDNVGFMCEIVFEMNKRDSKGSI